MMALSSAGRGRVGDWKKPLRALMRSLEDLRALERSGQTCTRNIDATRPAGRPFRQHGRLAHPDEVILIVTAGCTLEKPSVGEVSHVVFRPLPPRETDAAVRSRAN